jgi:hypothetical protein
MISNVIELAGIALLLVAAWILHPAIIIGLAGISLIAIGYARGKK